eukprot:SAG11_NODE_519_length_8789_cov_17.198044_2_plen_131_part_00
MVINYTCITRYGFAVPLDYEYSELSKQFGSTCNSCLPAITLVPSLRQVMPRYSDTGTMRTNLSVLRTVLFKFYRPKFYQVPIGRTATGMYLYLNLYHKLVDIKTADRTTQNADDFFLWIVVKWATDLSEG